MIDRRSDSYLLEFSNQESFLGEVRDMDSNSTWLQGISSRSLVVEAVEGPLLAREYAELHGLDYVTAEDTGKHQQLALSFMDPHGKTNYGFLRETAYEGLAYTAAGTGGASLPLLEPFELEQDINFRLHAMNVKDKKLLLLDRYGKISAIHSGADSGYAVMPITELLECSMDMLKRRFGTPVFHYGMNSHDVTTAIWTLPEKQEELLSKYVSALEKCGVIDAASSGIFPINFMPAVQFISSDTSNSSASLIPIFLKGNAPIRFTAGVAVKHINKVRSGIQLSGVELFKEEIEDGIYSNFMEMSEVASKLIVIHIDHPERCLLSLAKRYGIGRKYVENARQMIKQYSTGRAYVTAYDIYMCFSTVIDDLSQDNSVNPKTVNTISESIYRMIGADWSYHNLNDDPACNPKD